MSYSNIRPGPQTSFKPTHNFSLRCLHQSKAIKLKKGKPGASGSILLSSMQLAWRQQCNHSFTLGSKRKKQGKRSNFRIQTVVLGWGRLGFYLTCVLYVTCNPCSLGNSISSVGSEGSCFAQLHQLLLLKSIIIICPYSMGKLIPGFDYSLHHQNDTSNTISDFSRNICCSGKKSQTV